MENFTAFIESASLFSVFLTAALLGVGIFVVAFLLDGVMDGIFEASFGDLSFSLVQFVGVFLATTGASGLITVGLGFDGTLAILLIATAVGVVLSSTFAILMARLQREANKEYAVDTAKLIGEQVAVSWWKEDHGEILLPLSGSLLKVPAESKSTLINSSGVFRITETVFDKDRPVKVVVEEI